LPSNDHLQWIAPGIDLAVIRCKPPHEPALSRVTLAVKIRKVPLVPPEKPRWHAVERHFGFQSFQA
jgi:hypothetical protein